MQRPGSGPKRLEAQSDGLPPVSRLMMRWFLWYCRGYLRRHFHSLRVSREGYPGERNAPVVLYTNHPSWWDPLVGLVAKAQVFPDRDLRTPVDAVALERYGILRRMGFFGVEQGAARGARQFLRQARAVLGSNSGLLAVTPQGRFADVRERPVRFRPGLGHLAASGLKADFLPVAIEYSYWEERLPEILVRVGDAVIFGEEDLRSGGPEDCNRVLETALERTMDELALQSRRRDPAEFVSILQGGAGQGGVYDLWRAGKALVTGGRFRQEHGNL